MRKMSPTQKHRQNKALTSLFQMMKLMERPVLTTHKPILRATHYETPDEIAQRSGEGSRHDDDTESDVADGSSDSGPDMVRRYPTRARLAPSSWWTSPTNATVTVCHGEPIGMQHKSCHTVKDIESDSPTLKIALASPQRELWVEAVEYRSASDAQSLCCQSLQCRHVTDSYIKCERGN
jgi:hypothetical protein